MILVYCLLQGEPECNYYILYTIYYILQGEPECNYVQGGEDPQWETGDHRRQMFSFCGQDKFCDR